MKTALAVLATVASVSLVSEIEMEYLYSFVYYAIDI